MINRLSQQGSGSKAFINYRDSKLTRILQPALGGNSKTAIICTMTQTLANYQETLNTLHFGQKAKHVKTTVNVNEISQYSGLQMGHEMEKAQREISELRQKLREFEARAIDQSLSRIDQSAQLMAVDSSTEQSASKEDFAVAMLKDQLKFLGGKIQQATQEIEEKERVIQKLEHEKREFQRRFEHVELENFQMQERLA